MGVPGVPIKINPSEIAEAIKKYRGVVSRIHPALGMSHDTFYKLLKKHPSLKEALDEARETHTLELVDGAENALVKALSQDDMSIALKAAMYVLNNKGRDRGYNHPNAEVKQVSLPDIAEAYEKRLITQPDFI